MPCLNISLNFFQVHIVVTSSNVKIYIDCSEILEKPIKEAGNITTDGYEILGKLVKGDRRSATVSDKYESVNYCRTLKFSEERG